MVRADRNKEESGQPCPNCDGRLQVVNTKIVSDTRVRYLGCRKCGYRPKRNCRCVPLAFAPRRVQRAKAS